MAPIPLRRLFALPPILVMRLALDIALVGSWIWLASESLAQPVPALGAAIFGAVSAGYWATQGGRLKPAEREEEWSVPAGEGLHRLNRFTQRPVPEPAIRQDEEWFNNPELVRRVQAQAEHCSEQGKPMAVIFVRARAASLADWAVGPPGPGLAEVLPQLLDDSHHMHVTDGTGREGLVAFIGGDRTAAEDLLQELRNRMAPGLCEAGIVVHPGEGVEPAALVSLARMRLQQPSAFARATDGATASESSRKSEPRGWQFRQQSGLDGAGDGKAAS